MSTSQGRRLQRRDSLTSSHRWLALDTLRDRPRPQLLEQGLHELVWGMQFLCQLLVSAETAGHTQEEVGRWGVNTCSACRMQLNTDALGPHV